jgi:formate dehydrogenase subunit delta
MNLFVSLRYLVVSTPSGWPWTRLTRLPMHTDSRVRVAQPDRQRVFETMAERGAAPEGIAGHIKRFWDPRMRPGLLVHVEAGGGSELSNVVAEALSRRRGMLG